MVASKEVRRCLLVVSSILHGLESDQIVDFAPINYESLSGFDPQDITTEDRHDITLMNATNFVPFDKTDPRNGKYVVDFEGCLKAFL